MIVLIKQEAVNANCAQRGEILETRVIANDVVINVRLLGNNVLWGIMPQDIIGFEISNHLTIMIKHHSIRITE